MLSASQIRDYNAARGFGRNPLAFWQKPYPVCNAPFAALTFGHNGQILTCCYNRDYILGTYPDQTILEIWRGERAEELRKRMAEGDLSKGCGGCEREIVNGNYETVPSRHYDELQKSAKTAPFPLRMDFELSNSCNLECVQCSGMFSSAIRKNREHLPPLHTPYDDRFVRDLEPFLPHLRDATFVGGEPFLMPQAFGVWEKLAETNPNVNIHIQTNATIMNPRVERLLAKMRFHLGLSLDSLEKNNYERIRVNGKFETVQENVKRFHEYARRKETSLTVSFCIMPQNWEETPNFVEFANRLEVPVFFNPVHSPSSCSLKAMSRAELKPVVEFLSSQNLPEKTPLQSKNKFAYDELVKTIVQWAAEASDISFSSLEKINRSLPELPETSKEKIFAKVRQYVDLQPFGDDVKADNFRAIAEKMEAVYAKLEGEVAAEQFSALLNRQGIDQVAKSALQYSIDDLYLLAKTAAK